MKKYIRHNGKLYRAVDRFESEGALKEEVREVREEQLEIESYVRSARKTLIQHKEHLEYLIKLFKSGGSKFKYVKGAEEALLGSCEKSYKKVNAALAALKGI